MRALVVVLAMAVLALAPRPSRAGSFEDRPCALPGVTPDLAPRLRCGIVRVPRDHSQPGGDTYALAVVVIHSAASTHSDPVLHISGGPGAPLTIFTAAQARVPYAPGRDTILVDQRGTGRSEPALCPQSEPALLDATLASLAAEDGSRADQAYASCRAEAIRLGHDLANFGTRVTVEDLDAVRQALGIDRWNVYGKSYGTTVALTLAAMHPETVRSVVLEAIYPPDPGPPFAENVRDAKAAFFALCASDAPCAAAYPDLRATYADAVARLQRYPLSMPSAPGGIDRLTAKLFEVLVGRAIYEVSVYPTLPRIILAADRGDAEPFAALLARDYDGVRALRPSLYAAVECRDRPRYRQPPPGPEAQAAALYQVCPGWSALGPPPMMPNGTATPFLVLAGRMDPTTRPALSRQITRSIGPAAQWFEFPTFGHSIRFGSPCSQRMVAAFIDAPAQSVDAGCIAAQAPTRFMPP